MRPVFNESGLQVWKKPLASGDFAVVLFFRGNETGGLPSPPAVKAIGIDWAALDLDPAAKVKVRDLWERADVGVFSGSFVANVSQREAKIFTFVRQ
jgi:alpha-galactosidase